MNPTEIRKLALAAAKRSRPRFRWKLVDGVEQKPCPICRQALTRDMAHRNGRCLECHRKAHAASMREYRDNRRNLTDTDRPRRRRPRPLLQTSLRTLVSGKST